MHIDQSIDSRGSVSIYNSEKHFKRDCPDRKNKKWESSNTKNQGHSSLDASSDGYKSLEVLMVFEGGLNGSWIMDSWCSYHMTHDIRFIELKRSDMGSVKMGDDGSCQIEGYGDVRLMLENGIAMGLRDHMGVHCGFPGSN